MGGVLKPRSPSSESRLKLREKDVASTVVKMSKFKSPTTLRQLLPHQHITKTVITANPITGEITKPTEVILRTAGKKDRDGLKGLYK
jgi:hypothetical protein